MLRPGKLVGLESNPCLNASRFGLGRLWKPGGSHGFESFRPNRVLLAERVKYGARPISNFADERDGILAVEGNRVQQLVVTQRDGVLGKSDHGWHVKREVDARIFEQCDEVAKIVRVLEVHRVASENCLEPLLYGLLGVEAEDGVCNFSVGCELS